MENSMLQVNEYFDGTVKSIGLTTGKGPATIGVMEAGSYNFGTGTPELMTVVSGSLTVKLPGSDEWETFTDGTSFNVPGESRFDVKADVDTAYICYYG